MENRHHKIATLFANGHPQLARPLNSDISQASLHEEVLGLSGKLWQHYLKSLSQVPTAHEQNQPPLSPATEQAQSSKPWSSFA